MGIRSSEERLLPTPLSKVFLHLMMVGAIVLSPFPAVANGEHEPESPPSEVLPFSACAHLVGLSRPAHAVTEQDRAVQDVLGELFQVCHQGANCGDARVRVEYRKAAKKKGGRWARWFSNLERFNERTQVLLVWAGASVGPGVMVYFLSAASGLPQTASGVLGTLFGMMGGVFFGKALSPFERPWGARVEQWANRKWNGVDLFSKLQQTIPETHRIANGQIYNMHYSIRGYLRRGAEWLAQGNLRAAGMNYGAALLASNDLFAGMHLDFPVTIRMARLSLRELGLERIPAKDREEVVAETIRYIESLEPDELAADYDHPKLMAIVGEIVRVWLTYGDSTETAEDLSLESGAGGSTSAAAPM